MSEGDAVEKAEFTPVQQQMLDFFADGARVLGLPKSVGEIYGMMYGSEDPVSLDDLVAKLGISKGSGSQGLKMLRTLGAVREVDSDSGRKVFYEADTELKSLVGGFIREEVRPHMKSAKQKIKDMKASAKGEGEFYEQRVKKLNSWRKKAGLLLPVLQKILGG